MITPTCLKIVFYVEGNNYNLTKWEGYLILTNNREMKKLSKIQQEVIKRMGKGEILVCRKLFVTTSRQGDFCKIGKDSISVKTLDSLLKKGLIELEREERCTSKYYNLTNYEKAI